MESADYRDLVAEYLVANFAARGLSVYTEVPVGKTIIGKNRRVDVFVLRESDQRSLAIECKYQRTSGTTDEKIPYALQDLEAMWVPGCLAYAGEGWSKGVLHTLESSRAAVYCLPDAKSLKPSKATLELDHVIAAVFGLWDLVIPERRRFAKRPSDRPGPKKAKPAPDGLGKTGTENQD
jgi:hypothetical protein